jgi:hypothetical protein
VEGQWKIWRNIRRFLLINIVGLFSVQTANISDKLTAGPGIEKAPVITGKGRMIINKMLWFLPVLFLCGGCATTFTHPSKGPDEFERDRAACERVSRQKLAAKGIT